MRGRCLRAYGGKELYFEAAGDSERLSKIVVVLKNEFGSAGLYLASFDFDDPTKGAIPKVSELLYDTIAYVVKNDSAAEHFLLGTDSVSDRDGRRALLDLINKGCVPPGVRQTLQEEYSQPRYLARVDPHPMLAKEQRLVRDNRDEDWTPTKTSRKYKMFERLDPDYAAARVRYPMPNDLRPVPLMSVLTNLITHIYVSWEQQQAELGGAGAAGGTAAYCMPADGEGAAENMHTLALCHIFQVAANVGAEAAFAAAVAEYGAPAVLTGDESDGIDVPAYGFSVPGSDGVLAELDGLTSRMKAMEAKVGVHLSQVSLLDNDDMHERASRAGERAFS
ncbi:hypothetical protein CYMTET_16051 [Cymbomonas tetramitiformis]|uniref:Uncharacterized protein n=1 Tax=Cymbomonas tetramitiformis TaxID=36881 RepID=A0AAE0L8N6_9CHLO|nr:hypothetical protein CYMTET_16051 [Cymbomonas tetramitiformis]